MNYYEITNLKEQLYHLQVMKKKVDDGNLYCFIERFLKKNISNRSSVLVNVCDDIILVIDKKDNTELKLSAIKSAINYGIGEIEDALKIVELDLS